MQDMDRMRYVGANYERLQGLLTVVNGLFLLGMALINLVSWWTGSSAVRLLLTLVLFGVLIALYLAARAYYQRTIGHVRHTFGSGRDWLVGAVLVLALVAAFALPSHNQPVYWSQLFLGVMLFALMWPERHYRGYYLLLAALIAACSFLPLAGVLPTPTREEIIYYGVPDPANIVPLVSIGVATLIGGILDHMLLIRSLPPRGIEQDTDGAL